ncbi:MAG TPA: glutamyl-tRNA amidotransferase [Mycobacteriales bacterium]|nr:glutamyl-tRNA amidotransferase [Mycobacteriales bacterium]
MSSDVEGALRTSLVTAMKTRDVNAVRALRTTIAALDNAAAPPPTPDDLRGVAIEGAPQGAAATDIPRLVLSDDDVYQLVRREIDHRLDAAAMYDDQQQPVRAAQLRAEAAVLETVLESSCSRGRAD